MYEPDNYDCPGQLMFDWWYDGLLESDPEGFWESKFYWCIGRK
jgi:hypothetical protein